ncbi:MAG: acyl-CoA dehydrogenase family protein [Proteobacteria bacterium]|nr:acyl-CoA dehydrogenase family protein [Pseudomonadota bacterium]
MTDNIEAAVRALLPQIRERASEIETARRMPTDLVDALRKAGMFRMLTPKVSGGAEMEYPVSVQLLRDLARADGSAGWSLMIGCETPQLLALLDRATFDELYASGPDVMVGGAFAPKGSATRVEGGYRVSGQWGFASGCEHAHWLFGNCVVATDSASGNSLPEMRCMMRKREDWQILDTWHTSGLCGTGSHDIVLDDVFVPEQHSFDLFGGTPCFKGPLFAAPLLQFALHIAAVALGIAEGALEELTEFAKAGKTRLYARSSLADGELFQYRLGHAEADVQAARAMLNARVSDYWQRAHTGDIPADYRTTIQQTEAWVVEMSARVVDACYTAGGGSSIYAGSNLQRRLRDIHTLTQHASAQEGVFADAGRLLLV